MSYSYTILSETTPRARKQYTCIWCRDPIPVGEQHVRIVSKYDGLLQDHRWHTDCNKAVQKYDWFENDGEFEPGAHQRGSLLEYGEVDNGKNIRTDTGGQGCQPGAVLPAMAEALQALGARAGHADGRV